MIEKSRLQFELLSEIFKALSHPLRIEIFLYLSKNPNCVCEIAQKFNISKSTASKHLSQMKNAGLITMKKNGTRVEYSIGATCAVDMITCLNSTIIAKELNKFNRT